MENWLYFLSFIVAVILLGLVFGVVIGKYIVKRQSSDHKALLSTGERVAYTASICFGIVLILFGIFFKMPETGANMPPNDIVITGNEGEDGFAEEGFPDKNAVTNEEMETYAEEGGDEDYASGEVGGEDGIAVANAVALA